jgi:hypothetical protein
MPSNEIKTAPMVAEKMMNAVEANMTSYAESITRPVGKFAFGSDNPQLENKINIARSGQITSIRPAKRRSFMMCQPRLKALILLHLRVV